MSKTRASTKSNNNSSTSQAVASTSDSTSIPSNVDVPNNPPPTSPPHYSPTSPTPSIVSIPPPDNAANNPLVQAAEATTQALANLRFRRYPDGTDDSAQHDVPEDESVVFYEPSVADAPEVLPVSSSSVVLPPFDGALGAFAEEDIQMIDETIASMAGSPAASFGELPDDNGYAMNNMFYQGEAHQDYRAASATPRVLPQPLPILHAPAPAHAAPHHIPHGDLALLSPLWVLVPF
ncbi:hypothetical protein BJ912DRAFT_930361 [Pholiota molesta]|nr:hypothetical protein BJ912DRAFT_930361 [Pholiota molesta]